MKWLLIGVVAVVGLLLAFWLGGMAYYSLVVNERVIKELRANPDGERANIVMLLTLPDGRQLPVNYLQEGNRVFAGADGGWWRAFRNGDVPVTVFIKGQAHSGRARTVMDDPEYTREIFERLRPDVPEWLPDWLNAYLVVVDLEP